VDPKEIPLFVDALLNGNDFAIPSFEHPRIRGESNLNTFRDGSTEQENPYGLLWVYPEC